MKPENPKKWLLCADTGGTFTDCIAVGPNGRMHTFKLLSSGTLRIHAQRGGNARQLTAAFPEWAARSGFAGFKIAPVAHPAKQTVIESWHMDSGIIQTDGPVDAGGIFDIGTGEETAVLAARLVTGTPPHAPLPSMDIRIAGTRTTNALLERKFAKTLLVVTEGFADLLRIGEQNRDDIFSLHIQIAPMMYDAVIELPGRIDANGNIIKEADFDGLRKQLSVLSGRGISTVAISLINAWKNPVHEQMAAEMLRKAGFRDIILSSETSPSIHYLNRTRTTLINAALTPVLKSWMESVSSNLPDGSVMAMNSAGGLSPMSAFRPVDSLLSGPAAGVKGAAAVGKALGLYRVISFDMGGTSTDVARADGRPEIAFGHQVGDAFVLAPAVAIETVAAGGGSICAFDGFRLTVGPESAGANPGPACYGAGGPLSLTDINLLAGRIPADGFTIPLDRNAAQSAFDGLLAEIEKASGAKPDANQVLSGFLEIADERMADSIRNISVRKGYDPADYAFVSFGGAGGQHACSIASLLGIGMVVFPAKASVLSAAGLQVSGMEAIEGKQVLEPLDGYLPKLESDVQELRQKAASKIGENGKSVARYTLMLRLCGQNTTLAVEADPGKTDVREAFRQTYFQTYGHHPLGDLIEVESLNVSVSVPDEALPSGPIPSKNTSPNKKTVTVLIGTGFQELPVMGVDDALNGREISGPVLFRGMSTVFFIPPGWSATAHSDGTLIARQTEGIEPVTKSESSGFARLEIQGSRLQSIADEMGEMLRRTSVSVNIKERLDYSCAIFDADGFLVANAAHIPVHLGALGLCIRTVMREIPPRPGDAWITNHPAYGGSHLPDITVISPFFLGGSLAGFTASRAHHAEVGGIRPGSMPPHAKYLAEEGCIIPPMKLIEAGQSRIGAVGSILKNHPWPSRSVAENIADIEAALAANLRGINRLTDWAETHRKDDLLSAFANIPDHADRKLHIILKKMGNKTLRSEEFLDDGTPLRATIKICDGEMEIDFTGTAAVHPGNLNATPAIVHSVVIYVLRLLVNEPVPLNEGLMRRVKVILPEGILNPVFPDDAFACPAVVGGNTETSQRLTDMLLKPFGLVACSQGTMNNVIFGNGDFGFYETNCGGTGAGPGFDGADARHHHMTNTRITDAEIMEHRYPVRVNRFQIRQGSGGLGRHRGGNGVIRELEFGADVSLSVLSQHRAIAPYGLEGGGNGATGKQFVIRKDGKTELLTGSDQAELRPGDRFVIETPGGGGYGDGGDNVEPVCRQAGDEF